MAIFRMNSNNIVNRKHWVYFYFVRSRSVLRKMSVFVTKCFVVVYPPKANFYLIEIGFYQYNDLINECLIISSSMRIEGFIRTINGNIL